MQTFLAQTPIYVQWDDHEVTNNWYPGEVFVGENNNGEYADGSAVDSLYAESLQAFYEFNPIMRIEKIYRSQRFGKHVEIFFPDYRSYRDPNPNNSDPGPVTILGEEQLAWLMDGLKSSTATWKIISSHDPFGIVTGTSVFGLCLGFVTALCVSYKSRLRQGRFGLNSFLCRLQYLFFPLFQVDRVTMMPLGMKIRSSLAANSNSNRSYKRSKKTTSSTLSV